MGTAETPTWVVIEREHGAPLALGPYPDAPAAEHAMDEAPLVQGLCEEDATDCYTAPGAAADAVRVLIDLSNPDHTGAPS